MLLRRDRGMLVVLRRHLQRIDAAHISRSHAVGRLRLIQRERPACPARDGQKHGDARRQRQRPRKAQDRSERPGGFTGPDPRPNARVKVGCRSRFMAPRSEQRVERIR